ncbi:MAG TPA: ABC transporter permease subunit [Candidatus Cloacimonadota bacterium]|nr:ABC transporter permease subunit [Candidatus Cloacimonadota bacterium]HPS39014.1 ABC transporter permease subunit [Candidatus Cloacimonadota bacterium]
MRAILTIAKKEFTTAVRSITTYIIFAIFLIISGFFFSNTVFKIAQADLRMTFSVLHALMLFYIPAITMSSIAGETSHGTFELLATMPIRLSSIIWGKFLAALAQLKFVMLFTLTYLIIIMVLGTGIDYGAIIGGYIGLILAGCAYIAIGIFASSLPSNQVLAFILAAFISAIFFVIKYITALLPSSLTRLIEVFGFDYHLQSFFKGVIDIRDILFFAAVVLIFMLLAEFNLRTRNLMQER